ncbi:MAG TPA: DNA repair protein RadA [Desulfobacteria bacterium]|nr:DNA repair protein RadA [Desulfobacteria bacterium]
MAAAKSKTRFVCRECGHQESKWLGRCPGCGTWNSMIEELNTDKVKRSVVFSESKPIPITTVSDVSEQRIFTGCGELDRVLGGGIVPGSLILIGGDPGIGKSTLALQAASAVADRQGLSLYVTGEESAQQTRMRALRLGVMSENLYVLTETSLEHVKNYAEKLSPKLIIIDSIQTVYTDTLPSAPGSVAQVRECTAYLMQMAKANNIPVLIVGHVTKEGFLAGPRVLEHMVDTVLYFEGERHHTFRILRAVKNRFGSTNEIGVFEMGGKGLQEVANPSEMFLAERPTGVSGSVVVAGMEGTRPMLVEIQALVSSSNFGNPRRMTSGIDFNRVNLIAAVLEKRVGLHLGNQDAYVNVAGGVRLVEPAVDLGIAVALASSFRDIPVEQSAVVLGEIGLTGEVRGISQVAKRIHEGVKLGFGTFIIPMANLSQCKDTGNCKIIGVETVVEAFESALGVNT